MFKDKFNFKNKEKEKKEKVYLKYHNDKILEFDTEEELEEFNRENNLIREEEAQNYNNSSTDTNDEKSLKKYSKKFLKLSFLLFCLLIVFVYFKYGDVKNPFDYLNKYLHTEDVPYVPLEDREEEETKNEVVVEEKPVVVEEEKEKPIVVEEEKPSNTDKIQDTINSLGDKGLVEVIGFLNTDIRNNYKYLKTNILNFYNGKETLYSTQKNLDFRISFAKNKYKLLTENEYIFKKYNKMELYQDLVDRYNVFVNGVTEMKSNINRTTMIDDFNKLLAKDDVYVEKLQAQKLID